MSEEKSALRRELEGAVNRHSAENVSNTPDFILAKYLVDCLNAFDNATNARRHWYGEPISGSAA